MHTYKHTNRKLIIMINALITIPATVSMASLKHRFLSGSLSDVIHRPAVLYTMMFLTVSTLYHSIGTKHDFILVVHELKFRFIPMVTLYLSAS